jgi:hypothetical protein
VTLTREERETAIILSDAGTCTIWTSSPVYARRLRRRLGEPTKISDGTLFWDIDPKKHSIPLPRRLGKPRKAVPGRGFQPKPKPPLP